MEIATKDVRYFLRIFEGEDPRELLRVGTQGGDFSITDCDVAAFLARLRERGKRPPVLFRGFLVLHGLTWSGELLFSELVTHRMGAIAVDLSVEESFDELAREFF